MYQPTINACTKPFIPVVSRRASIQTNCRKKYCFQENKNNYKFVIENKVSQ